MSDKKGNMRSGILVVLLLSVMGHAAAKVKLPDIFGDGMVLQQQSNVAIWGKSAPGQQVSILTSWNQKKYTVSVNADSTWKVKVATPKAGGPYQMTITNHEVLVIKNILIGEVWLISGQSNMEMPMAGRKAEEPILGGSEAIVNSANDKIRFFRGQHKTWGIPLDNVRGVWQLANPQNTPKFSALGYFFAQKLQAKLNVPIGIVQIAYGGTPIEAWMSREALIPFREEVKLPEKQDNALKDKHVSTGLFNAMIHPLIGFAVKGMLWYQGENNRNKPELYAKLFPIMVEDWRKLWNIGGFPFYFVQIAPYAQPLKYNAYVPFLREAQLKSLEVIPNSGMVVNMDLGTENTIHPPYKEILANRMLALVLNRDYGYRGVRYNGPSYQSMEVLGNKVTLLFNDVGKGLKFSKEDNSNFEIAGIDKVFHLASKLEIKNNSIVLSSDNVDKPVAVRYAFKAWVVGNLYNAEGFPASSFRTDSWEIPK